MAQDRVADDKLLPGTVATCQPMAFGVPIVFIMKQQIMPYYKKNANDVHENNSSKNTVLL